MVVDYMLKNKKTPIDVGWFGRALNEAANTAKPTVVVTPVILDKKPRNVYSLS